MAFIAIPIQQVLRQHNEPAAVDSERVPSVIGLPIGIKIPSLNLEAPVEHVAVATDGSMDVPKLPFNVAWYKLGPRPGETGSAVIDGHVNWKGNSRAVFSDLHKLKSGDQIFVEDAQGKIITFVVQKSETYSASADATNIFTSNDGKAHLNLITCSGDWNKGTNTYSQRLVVFADKIE